MSQENIMQMELTDLSEWEIPTEPTIYRETQMIALCDESLADMDPAADQ